MRLAKISSTKILKNGAQKTEQQPGNQPHNNDYSNKPQGGKVKRISGPLSLLSSSNSGSYRNSLPSVVNANSQSFGNGSCISLPSVANSNTLSKRALGGIIEKRRKSKTTKCFNSTVFRCCLPCRGGSGSAAPATSPPHTPILHSPNGNTCEIKSRKHSRKSSDLPDVDESFLAAAAASLKKHSLADTINTSATTPISLKTLINDEEEDLEAPQLSAVDIATATLASGILPRKAEPETLSDTSISPTAAVVQIAAGSASASSLLSTTTSLLSATATGTATQSSAITPLSKASESTTLATGTIASTIVSTASTAVAVATAAAGTTPPRCCCPPQTSPLPHIKEEEESEQLFNRQHSAGRDDDYTESSSERPQLDQLLPYTTNPSGSSESCTSLSATTAGCTTQDFNTSTPSPRIKLKFRKQHKAGWSRIILTSGATSYAANSSDTLASTGSNTNNSSSVSAATVSATIGAHHQNRLISSLTSALGVPQSSSSQLLPASKMQAEQGSIGDLQKYHSRYLKNRRHTLANVR